MRKKILIITSVGDIHSYAVFKALEKKKIHAVLWHSSDFPAQGVESIYFINKKRQIEIDDSEIQMINPSFSAIWLRRPSFTINDKILYRADRDYSLYQCQSFRRLLYDFISPGAFWVNPREKALQADSKILQQNTAITVGLKIPDTLYSNDSEQIRRFIKTKNGSVVFKPLQAAYWVNKENVWTNYSRVIQEKDLIDADILRQTPAIYQESVPKLYELRITMMGKRAFGAKILSQQTESGKMDWRCGYDELKIETWDVPTKLARMCFKLLQKLGLVFGCFDFIVTPGNELIFLEVNQMGQFLFIEVFTGYPLLDAFTEFLIQSKIDFKWDITNASIKYKDILPDAEEMSKKSLEKHSVNQYEDDSDPQEEKIR